MLRTMRRISSHVSMVGLLIAMGAASAIASDVLTYHNDLSRTGQNLNETILTTSNVNSTGFGLLFTMDVDSTVDAQPLYVSSLTIAGVSHNCLLYTSRCV